MAKWSEINDYPAQSNQVSEIRRVSLPASVRSRSTSISAIIYISVTVNTSHYYMNLSLLEKNWVRRFKVFDLPNH